MGYELEPARGCLLPTSCLSQVWTTTETIPPEETRGQEPEAAICLDVSQENGA